MIDGTSGYSEHIYSVEAQDVLWNDNMDKEAILMNLEVASWNIENLSIREIFFRDGVPHHCHVTYFDFFDRKTMVENVICRLAELSLTHRIMYSTDKGQIYVTSSKDHQTNIDAFLLDEISRYFGGERK